MAIATKKLAIFTVDFLNYIGKNCQKFD